MTLQGDAITQPRVLRRRILVVDDSQDVTLMMSELLAMLGHDVRAANDGPTALAIADEFAPDLVLLDLGMPEMDGYEVAQRLRAQPGGQAIELVAVSGWATGSVRQRAEEAGFNRQCTKPLTLVQLRAILARC
jgi:CheY-like chemotaxis protein